MFSEVSGTATDLGSWHALLTGTLPTIQRIEAAPAGGGFNGRLSRHILDGITAQLIEVEAAEHTVSRTEEHIRATPEPRYLVLFQLEGTSVLRQSEGEARLEPGDFSVVTSTVPYTWTFDGPFVTFAVSFPHTELDAPASALLPMVACRLAGGEGYARHVSAFVARIARDHEALRGPLGGRIVRNLIDLVTTSFLEYLDRHAEDAGGAASLFQRLTEYVGEHLSDPDLDSAAVAEANYVSLRYVQSIFQAHGTTVSAWIRERRLAHCRRDLADPALRDRSIADIAQRWGIRDPAYFSRVFKQEFGESPRQWRERAATRVGG